MTISIYPFKAKELQTSLSEIERILIYLRDSKLNKSDYSSSGGSPAGTSGQLQFNNAGVFGGAAATTYAASGTHLTITALTAASKPLILKGAVSQTGNLLELQNSTSTALAFFNKDGNLYLGGNSFDYLSSPFGGGSFGWTTPFRGTVQFAQGQSGQLLEFVLLTAENKKATFTHYDVANAKGRLFEVLTDPAVFVSFSPSGLEMVRMNGFGTADITSGANWVITSPYAAKEILILKGAASQTSNALQVQDSSGAVLTRIKSTGVLNLPAYTVATLPAGAAGDRCYVTNALAPTFLTALVGGGAVTCPAFHNGTTWVAG